jgi:hypothetical protein
MATQDDEREREMLSLFNLEKPEGSGRGDLDAVLTLEGASIPEGFRDLAVPFELKSATSGRPDFSTVRDLGLHHIEKWRPLHWLFGVYARNDRGEQRLQYCLYGSPAKMEPWYQSLINYARADFELANCVPALIDMDTLTAVLGSAEQFTRDDARRLMKAQYSATQYKTASDRDDGGYSREAMLAMLKERARYLIQRGSTRNNPHISPSFFAGWEQIARNHAIRLRELVVEELEAAA